MTSPRVLVVEDEESLAVGLEFALRKEGFVVELARDGVAGLEAGRRGPDLCVLDLMLPGCSGFEVLESLRREGHTFPVILLTALGQEIDKVRGLDLGADDYVTKPFGLAEFMARVRAHLRRAAPLPSGSAERFSLGERNVDLKSLRVEGPGGPWELSVKEVDMLRLLYREQGTPVSRKRFLDELWGLDSYPTTRTVDQHVAKLRKKIEPDPKRPRYLLTVHGLGYRLEV